MKFTWMLIAILLVGCATKPMARHPAKAEEKPMKSFDATGCTDGHFLAAKENNSSESIGCMPDKLTMSILVLKLNPECKFGEIGTSSKAVKCQPVKCPQGSHFIGEIMYKDEAYAYCEKRTKDGKSEPIW